MVLKFGTPFRLGKGTLQDSCQMSTPVSIREQEKENKKKKETHIGSNSTVHETSRSDNIHRTRTILVVRWFDKYGNFLVFAHLRSSRLQGEKKSTARKWGKIRGSNKISVTIAWVSSCWFNSLFWIGKKNRDWKLCSRYHGFERYGSRVFLRNCNCLCKVLL